MCTPQKFAGIGTGICTRRSFHSFYAKVLGLRMKEHLKELTKIYADPLYFLRYVKIQEPGELALDYVLWPHLVDFYKALEEYKLLLLLKSKQIGISWALAVRVVRRLMTVEGSNVLMLSSGQTEAQKLLAKVRIIFNNLPEWIKDIPEYEKSPDSTEQFGLKGMKSLVTAYPSTEKAGIGQTSDWVIHDEADFHEYFEVNLGHTLATIADNPSRQATIVTTVDKTSPASYFKGLYKAANGSGYPESGSNSFQAMFFGYNVRPNRDEAFLEEQRRQNEATPWVVEANYPETAKEALSPLAVQSCFNKDKLTKLWDNVIIPETKQGYIHILYPPRVGTLYVAGVDVGEGVGLDYSCLTIIGKEGLRSEVVAVIYTNTLATDLFAYEVDILCREYFTPLLAIENNSLGVAVTNKVVELGYPKLFYSDDKRQKVGWTTGEKNKQIALIELVASVNDGSLVTRWKPQVQEMMEYQWVNAKPVATGKTHGDTVISLMLAKQMLKRAGVSQKISVYIRGVKVA